MKLTRTSPEPRDSEPSVKAAVLRFALAGLIAVAIVGLLSFFLMRRIGTTQATENASEVTGVIGEGVVEPNLSPALLADDPAALERFDRLIREDVLSDQIVRVKLWDEDGRIVYSDEPRLIGQKFDLGADERQALRTGAPDAELSDVSEPENQYERDFGQLLEAYARIRAPDGQPLLFETYTEYGDVTASGRDLWLAFLPALILSLLLLELIQLPLASSLARRVRSAHRDRVRLLERAVDASDRERRRIAGDLHDGAVQDLTGVALSLEVGARRVEDDPDSARALRSGAARTRATVRSLRSLLVEIYPPSLQRAGLVAALEDMLAPLEARGIETSLEVGPGIDLDVEREALCFRVAQEAVRNALKHAGAGRVAVALEQSQGAIRLTVTDDGRGFDPATAAGETGHIGTDLLRDLAAELDGEIRIDSEPGRGTEVALSLPSG